MGRRRGDACGVARVERGEGETVVVLVLVVRVVVAAVTLALKEGDLGLEFGCVHLKRISLLGHLEQQATQLAEILRGKRMGRARRRRYEENNRQHFDI